MKIEDGKGKSGDMGVDGDQRGQVTSRTASRPMYSARDYGMSFVAVYEFTAAANDIVAYLKNTSSTRDMYIGDVSAGAVNSVHWKLFFATGTAAAGETVTPTPTNHSKKIPAEAIAMAGDTTITGLTADGAFGSLRSAAGNTYEEHFGGDVILGPGDAMYIEYDSGTTGLGEVDIHFHYENLRSS